MIKIKIIMLVVKQVDKWFKILIQVKKTGARDLVDSIFENAKEQGAQEIDNDAPPPEPKQSFTGTGYRLGATSFSPTIPEVPPKKAAANAASQQEIIITVTFWKNGFSVDDGELRKYDDPNNANFLDDIGKGFIPKELETLAKGKIIRVNLSKKLNEDYTKPKPVVKPFSGQGQALGSGSTSVPAATITPISTPKPTPTDDSKPTTSIQIRLHDGTRLVSKFNTTHTIQDIRSFVEAAARLPAGRTYQLQTTMPVKILNDNSLTIAAAGLQNAVIVQKLL